MSPEWLITINGIRTHSAVGPDPAEHIPAKGEPEQRMHPAKTMATVGQAATAAFGVGACQFQGSSSWSLAAGGSGIPFRMSASQARKSKLFSLAVAMSEYVAAARLPTRSDPVNSHALRPSAMSGMTRAPSRT